jgi:hypothetical protein
LSVSSTPSVIKASSPKKAWSVGKNIVVVLDKEIVQRLGISEDTTLFEESVVDGGILLKLRRSG